MQNKGKQNIPSYQITCLFSPLSGQEESEKISKKIEEQIAKLGGKIIQSEPIQKQTLGYPIQKFNEAFYWIARFDAPKEKMDQLTEMLNQNESIIRHLITIVKAEVKVKKATPTAKKTMESFIDKVEPIAEMKEPTKKEKSEEKPIEKPKQKPKPAPSKKVQIEELDKKLEEILNQ